MDQSQISFTREPLNQTLTNTETGGQGIPMVEISETLYIEDDLKDDESFETDDNIDDEAISKIKLLSDKLLKASMRSEALVLNLLLNKFAEFNSVDFEFVFLNLIKKIQEDEADDTSLVIKNLNKKFSDLIRQKFSKEEAFKILYSEIHERLSIKKTAVYNVSAEEAANRIVKIVHLLVAKLKFESRRKAIENIRGKVLDINAQEVSNKKTPGGAVIGTSLSIIKNILNSEDPYYVNLVLKHLRTRL